MKKQGSKRPAIFAGVVLALIICRRVFGLGGGTIDVIEFEAAEVRRIEMGRAIFGEQRITITETEDMETVIDTINSFQYTGNDLKYLFRIPLFTGGAVLYEIAVYPKEGEPVVVSFCCNNDYSADPPDVEMSYWSDQEERILLISNTCRGSMEWYDVLYEKYADPVDPSSYNASGLSSQRCAAGTFISAAHCDPE